MHASAVTVNKYFPIHALFQVHAYKGFCGTCCRAARSEAARGGGGSTAMRSTSSVKSLSTFALLVTEIMYTPGSRCSSSLEKDRASVRQPSALRASLLRVSRESGGVTSLLRGNNASSQAISR